MSWGEQAVRRSTPFQGACPTRQATLRDHKDLRSREGRAAGCQYDQHQEKERPPTHQIQEHGSWLKRGHPGPFSDFLRLTLLCLICHSLNRGYGCYRFPCL